MTGTNRTTEIIIRYLEMCGHYAVRVNTVGVPGRRISPKSRGVADIVCVLRPSGKHLEIEVKTGSDRMSEYQIERQKKVIDCGGHYIIVSCFDDLFKFPEVLCLK